MNTNVGFYMARRAQNNEFYTRRCDIEKEMASRPGVFKGKAVYCPCDHYRRSQFVTFFKENFHSLGLSRLIATNYNGTPGRSDTPDLFFQHPTMEPAGHYEFDGTAETVEPLKDNGDFRSDECVELLRRSDVVATNPPFSLAVEFFKLLFHEKKDFIVLGHITNTIKNDIFPRLKNGLVSISSPGDMKFTTPSGELKRVGCFWYSTLPGGLRRMPLSFTKKFTADEYPRYENYDAIEVSCVRNLPCDYFGAMGVPLRFLEHYDPTKFEILERLHDPYLHGKKIYTRLIIRRKPPKSPSV